MSRERADQDGRPFLARDRRLDRIVAILRDDSVDDHLGQAEQQAGDDAADEQEADRSVGDQRVEHHRDRRRDDRGYHRRGGGDRSRIAARILVIARHHVDDDAAHAGDIGDGGARDAAEDHTLHHGDMAEPAAEAADQRVAEAQQPVRHAADAHQLRREQE
jgi:hypothetical protein